MKKNLTLIILALFSVFLLSAAAFLTQAQGSVSLNQKANNDLSRTLVCSKAFEALGKIGDPAAVDVLIQGLKSKDLIIRTYAIEALGRLNDRKAIPFLKKQLKEDNYLVKVMSSKALLSLGENNMEKDLLGFLTNEDPSMRAAAVEQLGQFRQKYMDRLIKVIAEDKSYVVRMKAIQQIGINKYTPAAVFLVKALDDPHPYVRQAACIAIGKVGYNPAQPLLAKKFDDPESVVRAAAKEAFGMLSSRSPISDWYIKLLWEDMESKEVILRASSFVCLAAERQIKVLPILLREVVSPSGPMLLRRVAARGLRVLKPAIDSSFDEAMKPKQPLLSSQDLELSYKINGKSLLLLLTAALKNDKDPLHAEAAGILGELKDPSALPELREALSLKDPQVVAGVAYVLGLFKDKQAAPSLIRLCKSYGF